MIDGNCKAKRNCVCVVCKENFKSPIKPILPLCSKLCKDKFRLGIKSVEDALNHQYRASCKGDQYGK